MVHFYKDFFFGLLLIVSIIQAISVSPTLQIRKKNKQYKH